MKFWSAGGKGDLVLPGDLIAFQRGIGADDDDVAGLPGEKFLRKLGQAKPVHAPTAPAKFQDRTDAHDTVLESVDPINGKAAKPHEVPFFPCGFVKFPQLVMSDIREDLIAIIGPWG